MSPLFKDTVLIGIVEEVLSVERSTKYQVLHRIGEGAFGEVSTRWPKAWRSSRYPGRCTHRTVTSDPHTHRDGTVEHGHH